MVLDEPVVGVMSIAVAQVSPATPLPPPAPPPVPPPAPPPVPAAQLPELQICVEVHVWQEAPAKPHALGSRPPWQTPRPSQHPLQVAELHVVEPPPPPAPPPAPVTQVPEEQTADEPQVKHALPLTPHALALRPG
jgi:hypothetical protein